MKLQKKIIILILCLSFVITPYNSVFGGPIGGTTKYEKEGVFVQGPADIGGMILYVPGYLLGAVFGLVYSPIGGLKSEPKKIDPMYSMNIWGLGIGVITFGIGYYIVGAPFYFVKKILWNFPKRLLKRNKNKEKSTSISN